MRYAWLFHGDYFPNPIKRALLAPLLAGLRRWDRATSSRVDRFVAISRHVQERIQRFYGRESDVVYPPANTDYFTPGTESRQEYDFLISAMVPYKRVDLAIRAYTESGYPLKVMGTGSGLADLKRLAGPNVEFLGRQPDDVLREHYRTCRFLLFPGEEDYGIVPVEAMACGTPVIAYRKGGATETVVEGETGWFFDDPLPEALWCAVEEASNRDWDAPRIRKRAERFDERQFMAGLGDVVRSVMTSQSDG
jgi:glycosyltransferase involved in cell wall biosynthesis